MVRKEDFDPLVPLPPGLSLIAIGKAIDYLERQLADLVEIYYEQANVFSAIVGIFGTKALDSVSNYEKLGGGRTHTFGVKNAAMKLRGRAVYSRRDVRLKDQKPVPVNGNGD